MSKTAEERLEAVQRIMNASATFQQTRALKAGTLRNRTIGEACTGYCFQVDNLSYRGIWLSTIEGIRISVDGVEIPEESLSVELKGIRYPLTIIGQQNETFWGARDIFLVHVNQIGGLTAGEHRVSIAILKRSDFGHSYGNGIEGYENAHEFLNPDLIFDEMTYTVA